MIVAALCLTGLAAGISQPAIGALTVDSVDEQDMGVANGMNQQTMFVGIVAGIQIMSVVLGDVTEPGRYAGTFLIGLAAALLGLVAALAIQSLRPRR